jgi:PAS domain S-box-containing protein
MGNPSSKTRLTNTQRKKRPTIGFFNVTIADDWALWPWLGVVDAAHKRDVNLVTFAGGTVGLDQANVLYDLARGGRLDGLIIWNAGLVEKLTETEIKTFCKQYAVPVVTLEGSLAGFPCVTYENYLGLRRLTEHLIQVHGYQKIGFLGMLEHHEGFRERYRGYAEAMQAHGLPIDPTLARPWFPPGQLVNFRVEAHTLDDYVDHAIALGMEAVIGIADHIAYQVLDELEKRNIRVPEQMAVVGFDDNFESRMLTPPLTTIRAPFYEVGYTAAETLVDLLAGKSIPDVVIVPATLMVRQSCGCQDPYVAAVTTSSMPALSIPPAEAAFIHLDIAAAIDQTAQAGEESIQHEIEPLLASLAAELAGEKTGSFLDALGKALHRSTNTLDELTKWHSVLSALRQQILPQLDPNGPETRQAEGLLHQAQVLISRVAERTQMLRNLRAAQKELNFQRVSVSLLTTLDINTVMDTLVNELPGLGIPSCYLSLFENPRPYQYPDPAPEWARLILAYGPQGRIPLESSGQRFPTRQLIPDELWPQDRACSFVLLSLHFQEEQIGLLVFESGSRKGRMYETLRMEISSALQGTLLVQRVQERSAALARHQYILGTFMANVPDSIYFKDRQSRITLANPAHARGLGLHDPLEEIGKTDFDFFPKEQARPKYEQEQEIIRTGKPILALEEPNVHGGWVLTTKMPLRDEKGEIIGTFGISRDITDLKQMQATLEKANAEISTLNERLKAENLRMEAELDVTRRLQQMLLPTEEELRQIENLDIAGFMQPADEVGGDYYDVLQHNGALKIGIGDVTGHGLESGVVMLMLQTAVRTLQTSGVEDPVYFLDILNRLLHANLQRMNVDKSMTLALLDYNAGCLEASGQLRLSGQHEQLIVIRRGGKVELIDTIDLGFPLGIEDGITRFVREMPPVELKPGDGVVLYSDGITEAENESEKFYGLERLCQVVSAHWEKPAEAIKDAVVTDVREFIGQQKVYDDLTLLVVKQK